MPEEKTIIGRLAASVPGPLTLQEARLLGLVLGLFLLGLAFRFYHLRTEHPRPAASGVTSERSLRP